MNLENYKGKRVLMTGGTGFLGKNIVPYLQNLGAEIITPSSQEFDLTKWKDTIQMFLQYGDLDYIIHGASMQGAGDWNAFHQADQFRVNTSIHSNVLEAWYRYQPQAIMMGCGSSCSYPGNLHRLREEDYLTGPMHESLQFYGLTKALMQQGIEAYKAQHPTMRGTTGVFATLYGPHDPVGERAHVATALITKFVKAKKESLPTVEVWGDGTATRELTYVDDQIRGLLMIADYNGPIINIGTGIEITIRELAELISELTEYDGQIVYNLNQFVGIKHKVLDVSLAKKLYGWTVDPPLISLREGLKKTIEWYDINGLEMSTRASYSDKFKK